MWSCFKANDLNYPDCVYCMCNVCYSKTNQSSSRKTRGPRQKLKSKDDSKLKCDHVSLTPFLDSTFFAKKFKDKILKESYPLPTNCSVCKCELIDIIQRKR